MQTGPRRRSSVRLFVPKPQSRITRSSQFKFFKNYLLRTNFRVHSPSSRLLLVYVNSAIDVLCPGYFSIDNPTTCAKILMECLYLLKFRQFPFWRIALPAILCFFDKTIVVVDYLHWSAPKFTFFGTFISPTYLFDKNVSPASTPQF